MKAIQMWVATKGEDPAPPIVEEAMFYRAAWEKLGLNPLQAELVGAGRIYKWLEVQSIVDGMRAGMAQVDAKLGRGGW